MKEALEKTKKQKENSSQSVCGGRYLSQQEVTPAVPAHRGRGTWKRMQVTAACVCVCECKVSHSCNIPGPAGVIGWEERGTEKEEVYWVFLVSDNGYG